FEHDGSVKPVGSAQALGGVMLSGYEPAGMVPLGGARTAYLFRGKNDWRVVLWDNHLRDPKAELSSFDPNWTPGEVRNLLKELGETKRYYNQMSLFTLRLPKGATVLDVMTNPMSMPEQNGEVTVALTASPVYMTFPGLDEEAVRDVFRQSKVVNIGFDDIEIMPLVGRDPKTGQSALVLNVINNTHGEVSANLAISKLKGARLQADKQAGAAPGYANEFMFFPFAKDGLKSGEITGSYNIEIKGRKPITGEFLKRIVTARRMAKAPKIDGDLSDWDLKKRGSVEMDTSYMGEKACAKEDISAQAWFGWDAENFYAAVKVLDDKYFPAWDAPSGFWNQDSVEFFFDFDVLGDAMDADMSFDDLQVLTVAGTKDNPDQPAVGPAESFPGMRIGSARFKGGYIIEYSFPIKTMPTVKAESGTVLGLDFGIDDADAPRKGDGKPYRKLQMQWSTRDWGIWKTPSKYGMVVFAD
ncbi:MAG: hypothetical protein JXN60_07485, partial [Lentisphaerae bacterium]|nr:hypothetical protein [Lentisphaerota bacterium]